MELERLFYSTEGVGSRRASLDVESGLVVSLCSDSLRMQNLLSLHNTLEKLGCYDESWEPPLSCVIVHGKRRPRLATRACACHPPVIRYA